MRLARCKTCAHYNSNVTILWLLNLADKHFIFEKKSHKLLQQINKRTCPNLFSIHHIFHSPNSSPHTSHKTNKLISPLYLMIGYICIPWKEYFVWFKLTWFVELLMLFSYPYLRSALSTMTKIKILKKTVNQLFSIVKKNISV